MTLRVLITAASKYGATEEMAGTIGEVVRGRGVEVDVVRMDEVQDVREYDAVVIGSAIYLGRWMTMAREFLDAHDRGLRERPVWLFSSGPISEADEDTQCDSDEIVEQVDAVEHRVFRGSIARRNLSTAERLLIMSLGVKDGDYRDWAEIRAWADSIAHDLVNRPAPV